MVLDPPAGQSLLSLTDVAKLYARTRSATRRRGFRTLTRDLRGHPASTHDDLNVSEFWAIQGVTLCLGPGEALGVMGLNGAGKSTLLRLIAGISKPDVGVIEVAGRVATLLDTGGFEPLETGRQAIQSSPVLWDVDRTRMSGLVQEIIEFSELEPFIDSPVRTYSKGMKMRLGFAISAHASPDLLLIDEVLAVGDLKFQQRCIDFLRKFQAGGGSLIVVSHSTSALGTLCGQGLLLNEGLVHAQGPIEDVAAAFSELVLDREEAAVVEYSTSAVSAPLSLETFDSEPAPDTVTNEDVQTELVEGGTAQRLMAPTHGRPVGFTRVVVGHIDQDEIRPYGSFAVTIGYRSTIPDVDTQWSIAIFTNDGQVAALTTLSDERNPLMLLHGDGTVEVQVGPVPLPPGQYLLRVAILEVATRQALGLHGWETPATKLRIEDHGGGIPGESTLAVLATPSATWSQASLDTPEEQHRYQQSGQVVE